MRTQKIRGHSRRQKQIDSWVKNCSDLDLNNLKETNYEYAKVWIHPWSGITFKNSWVPEPKRTTRNKIVQGLLEIYNSWKSQLDEMNKDYYLKIWLYEPRISESQVVCAVGVKIDYYQNLFEINDSKKTKKPTQFSVANDFQWDIGMDYDFIEKSELIVPRDGYINEGAYKYDKYLLKKCISKQFKSREVNYSGHTDTLFYIPKGTVWIGQNKTHPNNK
ncbi:MAG: hypothetical protein ACJA2M_002705 [Polaribacter sp.]|jgi:hypothetical protein